MAKTGRQSFQFMLRLPDELRDRLRRAADANNRSMNSEIVQRLDESFESIAFEIDFETGGTRRSLDRKSRLRGIVSSMDEKELLEVISEGVERIAVAAQLLEEKRASGADNMR